MAIGCRSTDTCYVYFCRYKYKYVHKIMYPLQQSSRGSDRLAVPKVSVPKMALELQRTFLLTIKLRVG